ncbi:MAG: hypothetical protein Q4A39_03985 [Eubacteriales bacterium]|nr:hypothetical protein [Eubacteriales bacterium]
MRINGREVGFAWTTGAYVDYNDWIVRNTSASVTRARIERAAIMNAEYNRIHKDEATKPLTVAEIRDLPVYVTEELFKVTDEVVERESKREVETEESKEKNAKSTATLN